MPYLLRPTPNQLYMFQYAPGLERCPACGVPLNKWQGVGDLFSKPRSGPPLSHTMEGHVIASPKFQRRCLLEDWHGLNWRGLSNGYDAVMPERRVRLKQSDIVHADRGTAMDWLHREGHSDSEITLHKTGQCATCGQFDVITCSGTPVIAKGEIAIGPKEIVASDIEWGDKDTRAPFWIVGDAIRASHKKEKIRLVVLSEEIEYEDWAAPTEHQLRDLRTDEVIPFPKEKRPPPTPPRRGSIRNPLLPDDI